jgi:hypothetical protein
VVISCLGRGSTICHVTFASSCGKWLGGQCPHGCHGWYRTKSPLTAGHTDPCNPFQAKTWIADCLKITPIQTVPFDNRYWCKNWALHLLVWSRPSSISLRWDLWTLPARATHATPPSFHTCFHL